MSHPSDLVLGLLQPVLALAGAAQRDARDGGDDARGAGDHREGGRIDRDANRPGRERGDAARGGHDDSRIVHVLPHRLTAAPA